jgi:hypothetical protein
MDLKKTFEEMSVLVESSHASADANEKLKAVLSLLNVKYSLDRDKGDSQDGTLSREPS